MKDPIFIKLLVVVAILGMIVFLVSLFVFNPDSHVFWQYLLVFGTLYLGLASLIALVSYKGKLWWAKRKDRQIYVSQKEVIRQSMLLSACAVGLIALNAFKVLNWWNGSALVATILVGELYFMSRR